MANQESLAGNFGTTELAAALGPTDLTIEVVDGSVFPTSLFYVVIQPNSISQREIIFVTSRSGTTLTVASIADRYLDGSGASSGLTHSTNSTTTNRIVKQYLEDVHDRIDAAVAETATKPDADEDETISGDWTFSGDLLHTGTNAGLFGASDVQQTAPAALTDNTSGTTDDDLDAVTIPAITSASLTDSTGSTPDQTLNTAAVTPTAASLTDSTGGTANQTLAAVGDTSAGDESGTINDNFADLADEVNKLVTDVGAIDTALDVVDDNVSDLADEVNKHTDEIEDIETALDTANDNFAELAEDLAAIRTALVNLGIIA